MSEVKYHVFEMQVRDRREPLRQVNRKKLTLESAKDLARIGAKEGKHDRAVTTNPKGRGFQVVAVYEAGTGENITQDFRANRLAPHRIQRTRRADPVHEPSVPSEITEHPDYPYPPES